MPAELYSRDILRLAASLIPDRIDPAAPGARERRSPACGSVIRAVAETGTDGHLTAVRFEARACALGQASAAILQRHAPGLDRDAIAAARAALAAMLAGDDAATTHWPEFAWLAPARSHPGRHGAILLGYDALLDALDERIRAA